MQKLGKVIHYFNKIRVAIVRLTAPIKVGMRVEFRRNKETFEQELTSIQIDHEPVKSARKGQAVGIKVRKKTNEGTLVFSTSAKRQAQAPKNRPAKKATKRPARPRKKARR